MFCPKCGNAEQTVNTYCRRCGTFLPDFEKIKKRETSPEQHLTANAVLNAMTAAVSLTLAILLYVFFLGKDDTPVLIYITAGFLTAMFFWQAQVFWRTLELKKHWRKRKYEESLETENFAAPLFESVKTRELLNEADFSGAVPPSVTDNTTNKLGEKIHR